MGLSKKSNFLLDRAPQKSVNASCPALRLSTHDSGSVRLARPSPYGSFIRTSTPVYPGASSALLSGPASRRVLFHPCASLSLHVHHVVKRTCTSQLSIMLGTQDRSVPVRRVTGTLSVWAIEGTLSAPRRRYARRTQRTYSRPPPVAATKPFVPSHAGSPSSACSGSP